MKKSRGLSSVIGMIFLVIVLSSTVGYFTYGVNLIEELQDQMIISGVERFDKLRENFEITNIKIDEGKFNLTIQNTGVLPINFTRLWVNNMTDNSWTLQNFTLNEISSPDQVLYNVGQNLELYALESQSYSFRLVTERGNLFDFQLTSPQDEMLEMNLFSSPKSILKGQKVTLWYGVTNSLTDASTLQLITPQIKDPPVVTGVASAVYEAGPIPPSKESLAHGDTIFFKWIYEVTGAIGDKVTFNATVNNAKQGNFVTEEIVIVGLDNSALLVENAGVIQAEYTSLEWAQDVGDWSVGWNLEVNEETVWRINITNNHPTDTIYVGDDTALILLPAQQSTKRIFYVGNSATTNPPAITAYTDNNLTIGPNQEVTIYFGATIPGGVTETTTPAQKGINESPILMFGKMCSGGGCPDSGTPYGQTIPFLGILLE